MPKRPPYVHLDQWYIRAVALYGRLCPAEWEAMTVAWEMIAGWKGRDQAAIAQTVFHRKCHASEESIRRAINTLATPAGQAYRWGPKSSRMGHGLLVIERAHTARGRETVYSLETDWRKWGWAAGADLEAVAFMLAEYDHDPDVGGATEDAENLARELRERVILVVGEDADVPIAQASCRAWVRWCGTMQNLLDRGWSPVVVKLIIRSIDHDEYWTARVVGPRADRVFYDNFDTLKVLADQRHRQRRHR